MTGQKVRHKMKIIALAVILSSVPLFAQNFELRERPNETTRISIFQAVSATASDGIDAIRADGSYKWSVTPIISKTWQGQGKALLLAIEVIGSNLQPSTAVFSVDGKNFVLQSADWRVDSRGNLAALFDKEWLVRNIASAHDVSITVFAPSPLTADFHDGDLAVFRSMVHAYDSDAMHLAAGEATPEPVVHIVPFSEKKSHTQVKIIAQESSTTPYEWEVNGRMAMSCSGNACSGYYSTPKSGVQQVQGAVLKLLRPDSSIVIVQCVSKVNTLSSAILAIDAVNAGDPNSPTVYRDCRVPTPDTVADAEFKRDTVKLSWRFDGAKHSDSETYQIVGVLEPVSNH